MASFLQRLGHVISGALHGLDRLRSRGSKRPLAHVAGMMRWLGHLRIPSKGQEGVLVQAINVEEATGLLAARYAPLRYQEIRAE